MEITQNQPLNSKRNKLTERLKGKYPDKDFSNDDDLYGQLSDDLDDYDNQLGQYKERETALAGMFDKNPQAASFLMDWKAGADPVVSLIRKYGDSFKEALNDPDKLEEIAKANQEHMARVAKEKEYEEQYQSNIQETLSNLQALVDEGRVSEDRIDEAMEFLVQTVSDGAIGKFSPEIIDMAIKAVGHDTDMAEAEAMGEVRGKNSKIRETLRKRSSSDGTATLGGGNGSAGSGMNKPDLGALGRYDDGNKSIWERGKTN